MFDAQRTAIKQNRQAIKQGLAFQRNVGKMTASALRGQESMQRQSVELAQAGMRGGLDVTRAMTDAEGSVEQRATVDDAFAQLKSTHSEIFGVLERELDRGLDSFDELSAEYVEALEEMTDQFLETQRTIEDETARGAEELSEDLLDQLERSQGLLDQLEDQFERQTERTEQLFERQVEGAEEFQQQLEEEAQRMQRRLETAPVAAVTAGEERTPLEHIDGLDDSSRDDLIEAGITSAGELAAAEARQVADATDVSEERAESWIDQAQD
ncbi:helix-hairpin-helix domain-containing protein [Halovivax sp.]|uniref:helix-hairpin-helix domain-containing protein n=1 Tax=Halovivax sp. TaxID=1935978 RepID=UPI0025BB01A9|nr:helix-hairpin-helix domain-containing protein [Halovivax sp.]